MYTAVQAYLDQDATGELMPEAEAGKPEFKVFLGFKKENVSYNGFHNNDLTNYCRERRRTRDV